MTWTSEARLVEALVQAGAGRGVLPVFAGDANPALEREGEIIATLDHPLWIVANDDDRRRPEVRLVIEPGGRAVGAPCRPVPTADAGCWFVPPSDIPPRPRIGVRLAP